MSSPIRILFVDDEPAYRRIFQSRLRRDQRFLVETAGGGEEALQTLKQFSADIVLTDLKMPFMDGIELLERIKEQRPEVFVLILTGIDSTSEAVRAMRSGAYDYLLKPLDLDMVMHTIEKILAHRKAFAGHVSMREGDQTDYRFENIIGQDQKMFEIYEMISQVSQTQANVLITGESGTGKELIAEAIHAHSARREQPFLQVNCAALTDTLINSELFGHEKGAFTGATATKRGYFERANGGTIFLDEIGDIPIATQVALLRVLELGTFQRVGGSETLRVDVRLICATNRDFSEAIRKKLFREDLYYRINVVSLHAPPLRERQSDIPLLANYFLEKYCVRNKKPRLRIANSASQMMKSYPWPGNVRELANVVERAVIFCKGPEITEEHLPAELKKLLPTAEPITLSLPSNTLAAAEATLILKVLEEKNWNLKQAAAELDIARGTLYGKMEKYGINKP
ncbi:MAG: sigma-54 dependent transcriptional regulator [Pelovirga sp.]